MWELVLVEDPNHERVKDVKCICAASMPNANE